MLVMDNQCDTCQLEENQNVSLHRLWCHNQDTLVLACLMAHVSALLSIH